MVQSKNVIVEKQTEILFGVEDIKQLVKDMQNYLLTGEVFQTLLEDTKGNTVVVSVDLQN